MRYRIIKPTEFDLQLFAGSGAGLNRAWNMNCLAVAGGSTGTFDSGPILHEAAFFSKWFFQLVSPAGPGITGVSCVWYMTADMGAYWSAGPNPAPGFNPRQGYVFPVSSWVKIVALAPETAEAQWYNPLTDLGQGLYSPAPAVAVRCVLTATASSADVGAIAIAVP